MGVEAAGHGLETGKHGAALALGRPGVLHGSRSYVLQDDDGQIVEAHSISAGLDYPGVGPELSWLKDQGRVELRQATDDEALDALGYLARTEGIIPALETAHAVSAARQLARELGPRGLLMVNVSGRGDKDVDHVRQALAARGKHPSGPASRAATRPGKRSAKRATEAPMSPGPDRIGEAFSAAAKRGSAVLVTYVMAGDPDLATSREMALACAAGGADILEIGMPFSDPIADGKTIQGAGERALRRRHHGGRLPSPGLRGAQAHRRRHRAHGLREPGDVVRRGTLPRRLRAIRRGRGSSFPTCLPRRPASSGRPLRRGACDSSSCSRPPPRPPG